jgi:pyruvate dehydrogenase (quinone)
MATVSDFMLERLSAWGVDRIYGYPGDGINGILGALARAEDRFEFIQVPHEEVAAFTACAHAKFTGQPGVCMATSGPGAIHLLNGMYDAKLDHAPVVAIVGQQKRTSLGGHYQQEVDLLSLFKGVAGEYVQMCTTPAQMRHLIDRVARAARGEHPRLVARGRGALDEQRRPDQSRARLMGSCRRACPTTASSAPIPAASPTGSRAT